MSRVKPFTGRRRDGPPHQSVRNKDACLARSSLVHCLLESPSCTNCDHPQLRVDPAWRERAWISGPLAHQSASRTPAKKQRSLVPYLVPSRDAVGSVHSAPARGQYEGCQHSYLLHLYGVKDEGGGAGGGGVVGGTAHDSPRRERGAGRRAMPPAVSHRPSPPRRYGLSSAPASSPCSGAVNDVCVRPRARRPNPGARRGSALGPGSGGGKRLLVHPLPGDSGKTQGSHEGGSRMGVVFSPWSKEGRRRGCVRSNWGEGEMREVGCFGD